MTNPDRQLARFFPPAAEAGPDGLLAWGGQLTADWLRFAYRRGVFPWPVPVGRTLRLAWFSPDPRAILELDALHVSRRLARRLRSGTWRISTDEAFAEVLAGCAAPREPEAGVWLTPEMQAAYGALHAAGAAHSVEVWRGKHLVGGVYGVSLGGYFSAESMFHRETDASKAALGGLVERLRAGGYQLLDVQVWSPHLGSLGATTLPRARFLERLRTALEAPARWPSRPPGV